MQRTSGFSDGHRDLAIVEAVVTLGELDIARGLAQSERTTPNL
jgi:hypothetical protein